MVTRLLLGLMVAVAKHAFPAKTPQPGFAPCIEVWYDCGYTQIMKTAISIPDATFEKADRLARHTGKSRSELYTRAVETFIEAYDHAKTIEALNRIYGIDSSDLDPVLSALQANTLPKEDW